MQSMRFHFFKRKYKRKRIVSSYGKVAYILCKPSVICPTFRNCHFNRKKETYLKLIRIILIVSISTFILDSTPYLNINIFDISVVNIILSNIFLLLVGISSIIYEFIDIKSVVRSRKDLEIIYVN